MRSFQKVVLLKPLLCAAVLSCLPAIMANADTEMKSLPGANLVDKANNKVEDKSLLLKGEVSKINAALESLQEVGLDVKRAREAAGDLYDEVTIKPTDFNMSPNVVGATVISLPVHINNGAMMQPRAKWINQCMSDIEPIVMLLKQDVDDLLSGEKEINLPQTVLQTLKPLFDQWVSLVNSLAANVQELKPLTTKGPYDNEKIAALAGRVQQDARSLEFARKKIYKMLQSESKKARQKERSEK